MERRSLCTLLLAAFAVMALLLAAAGTYGVMAYNVRQKIQEIGVRMALGATTGGIRKLVLREALSLASSGIVIGWAGALGSTRLLASLLFGTRATHPTIFRFGLALLLIVPITAK